MQEPASFVTRGKFGTRSARWARQGNVGPVEPDLLGAYMQSRVADMVRHELERREWSVADLAAALHPNGTTNTAADKLRKRLTGRTWMTINDLAQLSAVLGMDIHRAAGESILPPDVALRVGSWKPGDGHLPTTGPARGLDHDAISILVEGLAHATADWVAAGGGHLVCDDLVCQLAIQQLASIGWPLAQLRVTNNPPTIDIDRPTRTSVRVVTSSVDAPTFEVLDEAFTLHTQVIFSAYDEAPHSLWVLHDRTLAAIEEEFGLLTPGTTVEVDEYSSPSTAEIAAEHGVSRPHWRIQADAAVADVVVKWLEREK